MNSEPTIHSGAIDVYLQGIGALNPVLSDCDRCMKYFIGSQVSHIQVIDHRPLSIQVARQVLQGHPQDQFATIFSQPAWFELRQLESGYQIDLYESNTKENVPVLWLGVTYDGRLPAHEVEWEIYRPIDKATIAFVALTKE